MQAALAEKQHDKVSFSNNSFLCHPCLLLQWLDETGTTKTWSAIRINGGQGQAVPRED